MNMEETVGVNQAAIQTFKDVIGNKFWRSGIQKNNSNSTISSERVLG